MEPTVSRLSLLYIIVFVNGAVLMGFEILGSRVLSPYFGNTIFVWGSLIGVFMAGMAIGYYLGGWFGDRWRSRFLLAVFLILPGFILLLFPYFAFPCTELIADLELGPRAGPLLASLMLFLLPSVFQGAVSPCAFVLAVKDLRSAGRSVGSLYAISTIGSIAGTLGTAFYLILWMGTRSSLQLLGGFLVLIAIASLFLSPK